MTEQRYLNSVIEWIQLQYTRLQSSIASTPLLEALLQCGRCAFIINDNNLISTHTESTNNASAARMRYIEDIESPTPWRARCK